MEDGESHGFKKGVPWTEAEHTAFLQGLANLGKGNWRGISRIFVRTRSPTQVASHAQKHFLRLNGCTKRRSRFTALEQAPARLMVPEDSKLAPSSSSTSSGNVPSSTSIAPAAMTVATLATDAKPLMFPAGYMLVPAHPGFMHPMFFAPSVAAALAKHGMAIPMPIGYPTPGSMLVSQAFATEMASVQLPTPTEYGLCKPFARYTDLDSFPSQELLNGLISAASQCQVALRASEYSAFKPAGRQVATA